MTIKSAFISFDIHLRCLFSGALDRLVLIAKPAILCFWITLWHELLLLQAVSSCGRLKDAPSIDTEWFLFESYGLELAIRRQCCRLMIPTLLVEHPSEDVRWTVSGSCREIVSLPDPLHCWQLLQIIHVIIS
jgi:hypothetical protein